MLHCVELWGSHRLVPPSVGMSRGTGTTSVGCTIGASSSGRSKRPLRRTGLPMRPSCSEAPLA